MDFWARGGSSAGWGLPMNLGESHRVNQSVCQKPGQIHPNSRKTNLPETTCYFWVNCYLPLLSRTSKPSQEVVGSQVMRKNFSWVVWVPQPRFQPRCSNQDTSSSKFDLVEVAGPANQHPNHPIILCDGGKGRLSAEAPVSKHQLSKFSKVSWSSNHWHPLASTGIHWHPLASTGIHWHPLASTGIHWHPLASTGIHCFQTGIHWHQTGGEGCDWKQAAPLMNPGSHLGPDPGSCPQAEMKWFPPQKWIKLQLCCDWLIFALNLPQLPQKIPAFEAGWGLKVATVVWSLASCGAPWKISRGEQKTSLNHWSHPSHPNLQDAKIAAKRCCSILPYSFSDFWRFMTGESHHRTPPNLNL